MSERVSISIEDGIADVRLNRPDKMNAIDGAMFKALGEASREVANNNSVRAVVLSGEGRAFCAGLDVSSFGGDSGGSGNGEPSPFEACSRDGANFFQLPAWGWQEVPVPVIAAVHGVAFGGGCQIALGADIRFIAPDAKMSIMEMKWGLIPDMSGTQTLRRLARLDVVKELTFTGRIISGEEAVAYGLATHVSDNPREDALALAREIAGKNPDAIRRAKQLLNASGLVSVAEGLKMEADLQQQVIRKPNQIEAVMATMEKRDPQFADPQ